MHNRDVNAPRESRNARRPTSPQSFDEMLGEMVQAAHDSGELRHLYGKPLDLNDDPEWLINNVLKNAGVTHPTLEVRREIETLRAEAEGLVAELERRREGLLNRADPPAAGDIRNFNDHRRDVLRDFERRLTEYQARSQDFNMSNLEALRLPWVQVDSAVADARRRVPELIWSAPASPPAKASRWSRLFARGK